MALEKNTEIINQIWNSFRIGQYTSSPAPHFDEIKVKKQELIINTLIQPLIEMDRFRSLDIDIYNNQVGPNGAYGVWLDYIGKIIGLPRPITNELELIKRFGFSTSAVGFNQGPFGTITPQVGINRGISDLYYTLLLMGRVVYIYSNGLLRAYEEIYTTIYGYSEIKEIDDFTSELSVFDRNLPYLWKIVIANDLIYKPLCHTYEIPMNAAALIPGNSEVFRFHITINPIKFLFDFTLFDDRTNVEGDFSHNRFRTGSAVTIDKAFWYPTTHSTPGLQNVIELQTEETAELDPADFSLEDIFSTNNRYSIAILLNDTVNTNRPGELVIVPLVRFAETIYDMSDRRYKARWKLLKTGREGDIRDTISTYESIVLVFAIDGVEIRQLTI